MCELRWPTRHQLVLVQGLTNAWLLILFIARSSVIPWKLFLWVQSTFVLFGSFRKIKSALRILTGKKHPKIKLQRLQKIQMLAFGSLVHQLFSRVSEIGTNFPKKLSSYWQNSTLCERSICSGHSICLNIGFWQSRFEWKWCFQS